MQRRCRALLLTTLCWVALARPVGGTLLTLAGSTLTVSLGSLPAATVPQNVSALPLLVTTGGGFTEPAGLFTGTVTAPPGSPTGVPIVSGFTLVVSNRTKQVAPGAPTGVASYWGVHRAGGGLGGPGRLAGDAIVNILGIFNLSIPLSPVGYTDGYFTSHGMPTYPIQVTVIGTGWTTGDVTITGLTTLTPSGGLANTVTFGALGFDQRTAGHGGVLQLVTPFKVITSVAGNLSGFALQTLTFTGVPEPGTLLLVGTSVAALVGYGVRRWRAGP
jgi:hypothetical protein